MSLSIRIYSTTDNAPDVDELAEFLEESDFEATVEIEEVEDDDDGDSAWTEVAIFEPSLDEPIPVTRTAESYLVKEHVTDLRARIADDGCDEARSLLHTFSDTVVTYNIELDEGMVDDDNALLLATLIAQFLAQRTGGIYCVDSEGFFDETGELVYQVEEEE